MIVVTRARNVKKLYMRVNGEERRGLGDAAEKKDRTARQKKER